MSRIILILSSLLFLGTTACDGFNSANGGGPNAPQNNNDDDGAQCDGDFKVSWENPTTNTDGSPLTDLAGIRIHWGHASRTYSNMVEHTNVNVTNLVIDGIEPGVYFIAATAFNSQNIESDYSAEARVEMLESCNTINLRMSR